MSRGSLASPDMAAATVKAKTSRPARIEATQCCIRDHPTERQKAGAQVQSATVVLFAGGVMEPCRVDDGSGRRQGREARGYSRGERRGVRGERKATATAPGQDCLDYAESRTGEILRR